MADVKDGDTVRVHYKGTLGDGTEFDSSAGRDPLQFKVGEGKLIPGFEQAVVGMKPGDSKTVAIEAKEAYGPRRDDLVINVNRTDLPPDLDPSVGEELELSQGDKTFIVRVTEVANDSITLDANHPLAGEDLNFEIELVAVV